MFNTFIQNSSRKLQSMITAQELSKNVPVGKESISVLLSLSIIKSYSTGNRVNFKSGSCQTQGEQLDVKQTTWCDSN